MPRSPAEGEPDFDLGWTQRRRWFVAEVKSLTAENETRQVRLGIGQVLDYQDRLRNRSPDVCAILVLEHAPTDPRWVRLCERHEITLVWPETFATVLNDALTR